ncbi:MAG: hypothetical protein IJZ42_10360 [Lachnospiraceae bacterium]|nr:hypothetical protein [Lachnospiraceae bacterium]
MVGIIAAIVYLIIDGIIAYYMKQVAYAKGYDDNAHAWAISFWLGLPGWIYVVALPDLIQRKNQEELIKLLSNGNVNSTDDELPDL